MPCKRIQGYLPASEAIPAPPTVKVVPVPNSTYLPSLVDTAIDGVSVRVLCVSVHAVAAAAAAAFLAARKCLTPGKFVMLCGIYVGSIEIIRSPPRQV